MGMAAEMLLERHSMLRYSVSRSRYPFNAFIMHWRAPLVSISGSPLIPRCKMCLYLTAMLPNITCTEKDIAAIT